MTSNCSEEMYSQIGYDRMLENYKNTLSGMVGPTKVMISGDTLQVNDYSKEKILLRTLGFNFSGKQKDFHLNGLICLSNMENIKDVLMRMV